MCQNERQKRRNFNCCISANTRSTLKYVVWTHNKLKRKDMQPHEAEKQNSNGRRDQPSPQIVRPIRTNVGISSYHTRYSFRNTPSMLLMENKIHSNHSVQSLSEVRLRRDVLMANMSRRSDYQKENMSMFIKGRELWFYNRLNLLERLSGLFVLLNKEHFQ